MRKAEPEDSIQKAEARSQKSEARSQNSEVRRQKSKVGLHASNSAFKHGFNDLALNSDVVNETPIF